MIDKILNSVSDVIIHANWPGACYESTAMAHVLLKSQGIESTAFLGVVGCVNGEVFDHAWLEIDGKIYDLAVGYPLSETSELHYYVPNEYGIRGEAEPKNLSYGIDRDLDLEAQTLSKDFSYIFAQNPWFNDELNFLEFTVGLGQAIELSIDINSMSKHVECSNWEIKRCGNNT